MIGWLDNPATTPVRVSPSTMMMNAPNRSVSASETISAAACACLRDEGAHRGEHQDLQQEGAAGAGVVVAVQLVAQAAVGPGDPHQREHDDKLAEPGPGQVPSQAVSGLADQHDHGQVIEELERTDHPLARLLAVRPGRLPQGPAQPARPLGDGLGRCGAEAGQMSPGHYPQPS